MCLGLFGLWLNDWVSIPCHVERDELNKEFIAALKLKFVFL